MIISRLAFITSIIDDIYKHKNIYNIVTQNNKVYITEGNIKYQINTKNISCQCSQHKKYDNIYCRHILYYLWHCGLTDVVISHLDHPVIYKRFIKGDNCLMLERLLDEIFFDDECGVCTLSLNHPKYNYELYRCIECKKYVHFECMKNWIIFKNNDNIVQEKGCIYCRK